MSFLNLVWAIILLCLTHNVICFIPNQQVLTPNSLPFPIQEVSSENNERPVYDPGDDPVKIQPNGISDDYSEYPNDLDFSNKMEILKKLEDDIREEQDIVSKSAMLMKLLESPNMEPLPVVYVEEPQELQDLSPSREINKRSRYYRRYPWKRQNSRYRPYEADTRYLCVPSREDVFKLLVGLHENRNGNHQKTVSFCNRKRPAKAIFTNIRFLG